MKTLLLCFCFLVNLPVNAQQCSDLYLHVDSLIRNELKFDAEIKNVVRENQPDTFPKNENSLYRFAYPLILLNGKPVNQEELDAINKEDIGKLQVIPPVQSRRLYGVDALNGAIYMESVQNVKKKLAAFNRQKISFEKEGISITIDKAVENKFFWKQLILHDRYFCERIRFQSQLKEKIMIEACEPTYHIPGNADRHFKMRIVSDQMNSSDRSEVYTVDLDIHRSYFYRVKEDKW